MGWAGCLGKARGGPAIGGVRFRGEAGWLGRLPRVADRVLAAVARCGWTDLSGRRAWVCGLFVVECGGSSWPAPPSTGLAPPRLDYVAGCGQPTPRNGMLTARRFAAEVFISSWTASVRTEAVNTAIKHIKRTSRGRRNNTHYSTCALFRSIRRAR